jgi:hypothetical protein
LKRGVQASLAVAAISLLLAAFAATSAQPATIKIASWNIQNFGQTKAKDLTGCAP